MAKKNKTVDEAAVVSRLALMVRDAVGVSVANIADKQAEGLSKYRREPLPGDLGKDGKPLRPASSMYVSADVQERTDWLKSNLYKLLVSQKQIVSFEPNGPEDGPIAEQQNDVVNFIATVKNSFGMVMEDWIGNGIITGVGIATVEFKVETEEMLPELIKGLTDEQLVPYVNDEEAGKLTIIERSEPYDAPTPPLPPGIPPEMAAMAQQALPKVRDIKIRRKRENITMPIRALPPEDFIVSKDAHIDPQTGGICASVQGHKRLVTKQELLNMKFDPAKVNAIPFASDDDAPMAVERSKATDFDQGVDEQGDRVTVYEIYTFIAIDDDTPRHHRITIGGDLESAPIMLGHEEVTKFYPYAPFVPYPEPNTLFGHSMADRVGQDHNLKSKTIRNTHNSFNNFVNPLVFVNENEVNLDDLRNPYPGKTIRTSGNPANGISYTQPQFAGSAGLGLIQQLDETMDNVTGAGGSMMSVNPSDLQNTTATASSQRMSAQQMRVEHIAQTFAASGIRYLFRVIIDLLRNNADDAAKLITRLTGKYENLKPDEWDPDLDITTNVAFGVTDKMGTINNMQMVMGLQDKLATMGMSNQQTAYNSAVQMTEVLGYKNPSVFFVDPVTAQQQAQAQAQQPPPVNPMVEAEQVKAQAAMAEKEKDRQLQIAIETMKNDREKDKAEMEFELKRAEITAKYAAQVDIARVQAEIAKQRNDLEMAIAANDQIQKAAQERAQQEAQAAQQAQAAQAAQQQAPQQQELPLMPPQA